MSETFIVRLRFSRREPAIWLAHLDMMRTFERSIRRAGLPICWSQGYNPRPQMTFALPISVGLATAGDYLDLSLEEDLEPADVMDRLNRSLPTGFAILAANRAAPSKASLMSLVRAADYRLETPGLAEAIARIANTQPLVVEKFSKGKMVDVDIRPLIEKIQLKGPDCLEMRVKAGSSANLRPDLFLKALETYGDLPAEAAADCAVTRLALILDSNDPESAGS
ncbi:MAG: TIGR03936 family radical SAM-associated protein [Eubacteriales bacterium]|nr:TIGR03936 family radical SAM-associated protein [Eubacteriales bacterium]